MPYYLRQGDLQIFEDPETYHEHQKEGYWGEVTSTIDWCERNYEVSHYIAEFHNTWSNVLFVILGLFGLYNCWQRKAEVRMYVLYLGVIVVGIGSAGFHGTLLHFWQQGDETPMVLTLTSWCYCLVFLDPIYEQKHPKYEKTFRYGAILFAVVWTVAHNHFRWVLLFQIAFAVATVCCGLLLFPVISSCETPEAKLVGTTYLTTLVAAFICWNVDVHLCEPVTSSGMNPQLHGWWHLLCGIACYCGITFLGYERAQRLGQKPVLRSQWIPFLPFIQVSQRQD